MVMLPLPPLQVVLAVMLPLMEMGGLSFVRLMVAVELQPLAPVTVTV